MFWKALGTVLVLAGCIIRSPEPVSEEKNIFRILDESAAANRVAKNISISKIEDIAVKKMNMVTIEDVFKGKDDLFNALGHQSKSTLVEAIIEAGSEGIERVKTSPIYSFKEIDNDMKYMKKFVEDSSLVFSYSEETIVTRINANLNNLWVDVNLNHMLSESLGEEIATKLAPKGVSEDSVVTALRVSESDITDFKKRMDSWQEVVSSWKRAYFNYNDERNFHVLTGLKVAYIRLALAKTQGGSPLATKLTQEQISTITQANTFTETTSFIKIGSGFNEKSLFKKNGYYERMSATSQDYKEHGYIDYDGKYYFNEYATDALEEFGSIFD